LYYPLRNHSNVLICCSRKTSYYYQWFNRKNKRKAFIWNRNLV